MEVPRNRMGEGGGRQTAPADARAGSGAPPPSPPREALAPAFFRVALQQAPSPAGAIDAGLRALDRALATAAAAGAGVLVLPELYLPGYNQPGQAEAARTAADWDALLAPRARAAGVALALGLPEREGDRLYNSAFAWGADGGLLAGYRKIQLFGPREKALFTPGERLVRFRLAGREAALLICYDMEFPQHLRALAEAGVRLVLCPTANMLPHTHVSRHILPAQAAIHGLTLVYANLCGAEGDLTYAGGSAILGPDGAALATAGTGPAFLVADTADPAGPPPLSTQLADYRPAAL